MEKPESEGSLLNETGRHSLTDKVSNDVVILDMAMRKEDYAIKLYQALHHFVERSDSKEILQGLMQDEKRHYHLLHEAMMTGKYNKIGTERDDKSLEITDYLVEEDIKRSSGPAEIIKMAIRREEESEEFYLGRIPHIQDSSIKILYSRLAREEAGHRKKLLRSYDDLIDMNYA